MLEIWLSRHRQRRSKRCEFVPAIQNLCVPSRPTNSIIKVCTCKWYEQLIGRVIHFGLGHLVGSGCVIMGLLVDEEYAMHNALKSCVGTFRVRRYRHVPAQVFFDDGKILDDFTSKAYSKVDTQSGQQWRECYTVCRGQRRTHIIPESVQGSKQRIDVDHQVYKVWRWFL